MKTKRAISGSSRPVIVWENRPGKQTGNVIQFPGSEREQEAVVKTWSAGPAVVTEVSSGFDRKRGGSATPQATRMSMAA